MPKQPSQFELNTSYRSLQQLRDVGVTIAGFVALTTLVFFRTGVGFDIVTPGALFGMAGLLYLLNAIGNFHMSIPLAGNIGAVSPTESLRNFGLIFLAVGLWQRRKAWTRLRAGELWHTFSQGVSPLECLPIRNDLVYRYADPVFVFLGGAVLRKLGFNGLGLWVMFSAVCLRIVAARIYDNTLRRDIDVHNSIVEARVQADAAAHFEGQGDAKARSLRETGGIPTGMDASLAAQIARRKKQTMTNDTREVTA